MIPSKLPIGTTLEQWERYEKNIDDWLKSWDELKPKSEEFINASDWAEAYRQWGANRHMFKPNKPGYFRANND